MQYSEGMFITLNGLLRAELAATVTYQQALAKASDTRGVELLRRIHHDHRQAALTLREQVSRQGGKPDHGFGISGTIVKFVPGVAKLHGNTTALKALKEGEEKGIRSYENALNEPLPDECKMLIREKLLPQTQAHIPVLNRLMSA